MNSEHTILVIDDDSGLRAIATAWLESVGFNVVTASDGHEGLARLSEARPDAVITDFEMPIMDGLDFCKRAREISRVPILVWSGAAGQAACEAASLCAGANAFVAKPMRMEKFLVHVASLFCQDERESARRESSRENQPLWKAVRDRIVKSTGTQTHQSYRYVH